MNFIIYVFRSTPFRRKFPEIRHLEPLTHPDNFLKHFTDLSFCIFYYYLAPVCISINNEGINSFNKESD